MKEMRKFTLFFWMGLLVVYLGTGERALDWAFDLPDLWVLDDVIIAVADRADAAKQAVGLRDWFGEMQSLVHSMTSLGG